MAMFCPNCGGNLDGTEKFCPFCGHALEAPGGRSRPEATQAAGLGPVGPAAPPPAPGVSASSRPAGDRPGGRSWRKLVVVLLAALVLGGIGAVWAAGFRSVDRHHHYDYDPDELPSHCLVEVATTGGARVVVSFSDDSSAPVAEFDLWERWWGAVTVGSPGVEFDESVPRVVRLSWDLGHVFGAQSSEILLTLNSRVNYSLSVVTDVGSVDVVASGVPGGVKFGRLSVETDTGSVRCMLDGAVASGGLFLSTNTGSVDLTAGAACQLSGGRFLSTNTGSVDVYLEECSLGGDALVNSSTGSTSLVARNVSLALDQSWSVETGTGSIHVAWEQFEDLGASQALSVVSNTGSVAFELRANEVWSDARVSWSAGGSSSVIVSGPFETDGSSLWCTTCSGSPHGLDVMLRSDLGSASVSASA
ncbi:MAG: hypothetical protein Kow0069_18300 [Promethearchaeota archaeon]